MIRILDRYVIRIFVTSYALCFSFFIGLFLIVDFFSQIDKFLEARSSIQEHGYSLFPTVVQYYLFSVPFIFQQLAPFITLMAAMFTITRLIKTNELFPMLHAGVSLPRVLMPVFVLSVVLSAGMIGTQEWLTPTIAWKRGALERMTKGGEPSVIDRIDTITDARGDRVRIGAYDTKKLEIRNLDVTRFRPKSELKATLAHYRRGKHGLGWYLTQGVPHSFEQFEHSNELVEFWETDITPDDILLATKDMMSLSFSQLRGSYRRSPDRIGLLSLMHHKITFPISNVILLLLGLSTVVRRRNQSVFLGIAFCLMICGLFFAADFIAQAIGNRGTIHPVLAAWLPVTLFGSLGISMFASVRT